jgi:hypothetical protein
MAGAEGSTAIEYAAVLTLAVGLSYLTCTALTGTSVSIEGAEEVDCATAAAGDCRGAAALQAHVVEADSGNRVIRPMAWLTRVDSLPAAILA